MRHLFLYLACLLISLSIKAEIYYVDIAGSNSNDGSQSAPWLSLIYAVTQATNPGDTIYINAGTHTLSSGCDLAVGVSLLGSGNNSIVNITITNDWSYGLWLVSNTVNTDGSQSISHLKFTGNSATAFGAIMIAARGNVSIHDCEFEDFDDCAVTFDGQANDGTELPNTWTINNKFYNNSLTNCCKRQEGDWMSGALQIGAQEGMHIYNNNFTENERGGGQCGYPIKYFANGYNRDLKIYDNIIIKLPAIEDSFDWNFAIELWNWMGGIEIYNNHIEGSIDLDHVVKGEYSYGTRIHDNYFGYSSLPTSSGNWMNLNGGLYIEYASSDVYIYNNEFKNLETPIRFSPRDETYDRINIYYNVFNQIGNDAGDEGCNLMNFAGNGYTINNLSFLNNTVFAGNNGAQYGMIFPAENFNNLTIRNNIFQGFGTNAIEMDGTNMNSVSIENNIFYENGTNTPNVNGSPVDYVYKNNLTDNPGFNTPGSDFSLQSNSPAIDAGIDVGLSRDYLGNIVPINSIADIGAFEFNPFPTAVGKLTDNSNSILISPNPAGSFCQIQINNPNAVKYCIQLYNIQGKKVYEKQDLIEPEHLILLDDYSDGIYLVKLEFANSAYQTEKLIIKR